MKILALDFDGVIADSQMECLFVGFNTYLDFNRNTKLFDGRKFTFDNFNFLTQKHREAVEQYRSLRPFVIDAFCYYVISYIIEKNIVIKSQDDYNELREKLAKDIYEHVVRAFYEERYNLIENNLNSWLSLVKPYQNIIPAVVKLSNAFNLAISTNNRKFTIYAFFRKHGIAPKIVIDSSFGSDKKLHIENIKNSLGADFKDIYFVDDQIRNLVGLLPLGVHCYLAAWGYNTKKQQKEAEKLGAIPLNQNDFYDVLSKK